MFHVLDHGKLVYSGELSHVTQYVLDHHGNTLCEAIRSGVRIVYSSAFHRMNETYRIQKKSSDQRFSLKLNEASNANV